jgi:hypothetical protein
MSKTQGLESRGSTLVHAPMEKSWRTENFDFELIQMSQAQAFVESTNLQELGPHILGYLAIVGRLREVTEEVIPAYNVESGTDEDFHWSGVFLTVAQGANIRTFTISKY